MNLPILLGICILSVTILKVGISEKLFLFEVTFDQKSDAKKQRIKSPNSDRRKQIRHFLLIVLIDTAILNKSCHVYSRRTLHRRIVQKTRPETHVTE